MQHLDEAGNYDNFTLTTGQDLPEDNENLKAPTGLTDKDIPKLVIQSPDEPLQVVEDYTSWFWAVMVRLLHVTGEFARSCDYRDKQGLLPSDMVDQNTYDQKMNHIRKLEKQLEDALAGKPAAALDITQSAVYHTLVSERNELASANTAYLKKISELEQDDVTIDQLQQDVEWEQEEANKLAEHCKLLQEQVTAKEQARKTQHEIATWYHCERGEQDQDYEVLTKEYEKLGNKYSQRDHNFMTLQTEYNNIIIQLQAFEPSYQPYHVQTRDRTDQVNRSNSPVRRPRYNTPEPHKAPATPTRVSRMTNLLTKQTVNSLRPAINDPAPAPRSILRRTDREDTPNRGSRVGSLHDQAVGSVAGSGGVTFRLPDIDIFSGKDSDEDYEKWCRTAVHKCETYIDARAGMVYLETRIKGNAWDLIKHDIKSAKHYLDILDAMDVYFEQEGYKKVMEAENALRDQSLQQKNGETFVAWKQRFMKVAAVLEKSDREMIAYAREFMRPALAGATTAASVKGETLNAFLTRARERDPESKEINRSRTAAPTSIKTRDKPRKRSPGDRSPERKRRSERVKKRTIAFDCSQEQRDVLFWNKACYKCEEKTHQSGDCTKTTAVPFNQIKGLNLHAAYAAYVEDEPEDKHEDESHRECNDEGYIIKPEEDNEEPYQPDF
jgi:hypothetical protein